MTDSTTLAAPTRFGKPFRVGVRPALEVAFADCSSSRETTNWPPHLHGWRDDENFGQGSANFRC
jgi:hypothetical protein